MGHMPITEPTGVAKGMRSSHWPGLGRVPPLEQGGGVSCIPLRDTEPLLPSKDKLGGKHAESRLSLSL